MLTQLCATAGNKEKKNKKEGTKTKERPTAILSTKIESLWWNDKNLRDATYIKASRSAMDFDKLDQAPILFTSCLFCSLE